MAPTLDVETCNDEGEEITLHLPARYEVCGRCRGNGIHVNPAIDGNGITQADREDWADDDFMDDYRAGVYDVRCEECGGNRVVPVVDEERADPKDLALYRQHNREMAELRAEEAAERRMGA